MTCDDQNMTDADVENLEVAARAQEAQQAAEYFAAMDDYELIAGAAVAAANGPQSVTHPAEMSRRLKAAIETLTGELIAFRKSSDRLAGWIASPPGCW